MVRKFKTVDYEAALELTIKIGACLPPTHLARFVVEIVKQLDLRCIYSQYGERGGEPYDPRVLLGLLFYGYATGVFSSRQIEEKSYSTIPFYYIAGGLHPDHDTINTFRQDFLVELKELFVQILLIAQAAGVLELGHISLDGSKIHADASKSKAVSYKRLLELDQQLQAEVEELFALSQQPEPSSQPEGLDLLAEMTLRQNRRANLSQAKQVLEARAEARYQAELADYEAKLQERAAKAEQSGRKPGGRAPQPPTPGVRDKDQYNFTDPDAPITKNSQNGGFDQNYNVQVAVEQQSRLIVASTLSAHANDKQEAVPTLEAISPLLGKPAAAALDNGYFSATNISEFLARGVEPYIATGREPHHRGWQDYFKEQAAPPPADASPKEKMAYKLQTDIGKIIYGLRKCTVEPVLGIIKEILGFRQFSLRGLLKAAGEWTLVCIGFNLKRLHTLMVG
ncbi:MAG: IS5/IS1182 family transposase [Anaerolineae bacterium]|nr:transposase [Anaerolineae bacterium]MCQ3972193.1 IS5/IS1182 family transposase [Anaerolineae bacterium]